MMTIQQRCQAAHDYHAQGFNCAQSVLAAFTDMTGLSEEQSFAVAGGFGGGMRYGGICGAVSGAVAVLGMCYPHTRENGAAGKARIGALTMEFQRRFQERFAHLDCHDLRGIDDEGAMPIAREMGPMPRCRMLIVSAVELLCRMLEEEQQP